MASPERLVPPIVGLAPAEVAELEALPLALVLPPLAEFGVVPLGLPLGAGVAAAAEVLAAGVGVTPLLCTKVL